MVIFGQTGSPDLPLMNPFNSKFPADMCPSFVSTATCPEAYAAKFASSGNALIFSSYLGGNICIGGLKYAEKLPTTAGAFQTKNQSNPQNGTGFVAKINPKSSGIRGLLYSTYLGGSNANGVYA